MVDADKVVDDIIFSNEITDEKPEELKRRMSRKLEEILAAKLQDVQVLQEESKVTTVVETQMAALENQLAADAKPLQDLDVFTDQAFLLQREEESKQ